VKGLRFLAMATLFWMGALGVAQAGVTRFEIRRGDTVSIESGNINYYRSSNLYIADRGVTIRYGPNVLTADKVLLDREQQIFTATGNVRLTDGESEMLSERVVARLDDQTGVVFGGRMFLKESGYRFSGTRIERISEDEYVIENGALTTCNCGPDDSPSWSVSASHIRVQIGGYASVRSALFYVRGVPVVFLPFGYFPVKTGREMGLLLPTLGYSPTWGGLEVRQALFIPFGDSADATLSADYYSARGYGATGELRYAARRNSYGVIGGRYIYQGLLDPAERDYRAQRFSFDTTHRYNFGDFEAIVVDLHAVSDRRYNAELGETLEQKTRPFVRSEIAYIRSGETASLLAAADSYARADLVAAGVINRLPHVQLLTWPRLLWNGGPLFNLEASLDHLVAKPNRSAVWDFSDYRTIGDRFDILARLEQPLALGPLMATPFATARETLYRTANTAPASHRELFTVGMRLAVPLERSWHYQPASTTAASVYLRHRVSPQARYLLIPDIAQDPGFVVDEIDLIGPRNLVEYGLVNQVFWIDGGPRSRSGFAEFGVFQHYAFQFRETEPQLSAVLARLRFQFPNGLSLGATEYIDPLSEAGQFYHSVYRVDGPLPGSVFAAVEYHNFRNYEINDRSRVLVDDEIDARYLRRDARTPWASRELWGTVSRTFFNHIGLTYGARYSFDQRLFVESLYGFSYRSRCECWAVQGTFIQRPNADLRFNLMFTLVGIGSVGY
jgi:LPS-assembly protein